MKISISIWNSHPHPSRVVQQCIIEISIVSVMKFMINAIVSLNRHVVHVWLLSCLPGPLSALLSRRYKNWSILKSLVLEFKHQRFFFKFSTTGSHPNKFGTKHLCIHMYISEDSLIRLKTVSPLFLQRNN